MCSADKAHYEHIQDQEVLMENISRAPLKKKQPGVSGGFCHPQEIGKLKHFRTIISFLTAMKFLSLKIRT